MNLLFKRGQSAAILPTACIVYRFLQITFVVLSTIYILNIDAAAETKSSNPRILILNSYHTGYDWTDKILEGIKEIFRSRLPEAELYIEFMDTKRHRPEQSFPLLYALYRHRYRSIDFDAVITSDDNALNFLLKHRDTLFKDVPVVFCGVNNYSPSRIEVHERITGVVEDFDLKSTVDIALKLHPETRQIAVISDVTPTGKYNLKRFREIEDFIPDGIETKELVGLSISEFKEQLKALPDDTVLLRLSLFRDSEGNVLTVEEANRMITQACNLPLYASWDFHMGTGVIGGMMVSGVHQGETAAKMAVKILKGTPVESLPVVEKSPNRYMFDYNVLTKFDIPVEKLPPDAVTVNQPESFYSKYQYFIWSTSLFILLLVSVILTMSILMIQQRNARLERAKLISDLEAKNAELERFSYTISHDLKSPLITIRGFISLLQRKSESIMDERMQSYITRISNASERMEGMLNDILNYSRIGRQLNAFETFDFGDLIDEVCNLLFARIRNNGIEVECSRDLPEIVADRTRIQQVLINLLENAVKFMGDQSGPCIKIGGWRQNNEIFCYVRDNGMGIESCNYETIFGLFKKLDNNTEGSGIGLAIARRSVEIHGGRLWVESDGQAKGSTFFFSLPSPGKCTDDGKAVKDAG